METKHYPFVEGHDTKGRYALCACGQQFRTPAAFEQHLTGLHCPTAGQTFIVTCPGCGRSFEAVVSIPVHDQEPV